MDFMSHLPEATFTQIHQDPCSESICPPTDSCQFESCAVIRSIAQVETSLADLLDLEAEKVKKAIEHARSVPELLAINKSVQETLSHAVMVEQHLCLKLQTVFGFC